LHRGLERDADLITDSMGFFLFLGLAALFLL
jgi:hypothetical protein